MTSLPAPPKSSHLSDPTLHPFLTPTFSATSYLNTHLPRPPTTSKSTPTSTHQPQPPTLTQLNTQTQTHISTLSAKTTTLSTTLTALTDSILRCSSRLAYEIEVLRTETSQLAEALSERGVLDQSIRVFLPNGLSSPANATTNGNGNGNDDSPVTTPAAPSNPNNYEKTNEEILTKLHTLHHVHHSLLSVKTTFALALSWPMPPSLLSAPSSLISVSPPSNLDAENRGQDALSHIRSEIEVALNQGDEGVQRASQRVAELRECVGVWKGTGEERARGRWVAGLEEMVERRRGDVASMTAMGERERKNGLAPAASARVEDAPSRTGSGAGFLRRLREEIYMD